MERIILGIASALLLAGMLLNLGKQPLYLEEPRRALIAMEMQENGNPWVPTELGEYYYNKPPVFNWVLMASAALLGGFHEWAMRLPTVLSTIGIALLIYWMGRKYVDTDFGWISALLFCTCGSVLIFFSHLGEIDLFYAFVSLAGFVVLFHYYETARFNWLFPLYYGLHAVGFLTKGLPSVLFIGLTLVAWLAYKKDLRRLFSLAHLTGIAAFMLLTGGYLWMYSRYNSLSELLPVWVGQAGERTIAEQGFSRLISHMILYPLDSLKDLLPFSLLIVFFIRRDLLTLIRRNEWIAFSALAFAVNFPVYWFSPGAKQRYLYMLFPFVLILLTWAWRNAGVLKPWRSTVFRILTGLFLTLLAAGSLFIGFVPDLAFLPYRHLLGPASAIAFAFPLFIFWKKRGLELHLMILAMVLLRLVFDLTALPQRDHHSGARYDKDLAYRINSIVEDSELFIYRYDRISFTTVYYLNRLRGTCLRRSYSESGNVYYLAEADCIEQPYKSYLEFEYDKRLYVLFRF